jgi:hypothetical protein
MQQALAKKVVEWRDADTRARAAEQSVARLLFAEEHDPSPGTERLVDEARSLRKLANEKLKAAIDAMAPKR